MLGFQKDAQKLQNKSLNTPLVQTKFAAANGFAAANLREKSWGLLSLIRGREWIRCREFCAKEMGWFCL
jgi:hypothetical protein